MAIRQGCTTRKGSGSLTTSLSFPTSSTRSSSSSSSARFLGRKRVVAAVPTAAQGSSSSSSSSSSLVPGPLSPVRALRKHRGGGSARSRVDGFLESLPQDVLIKVLCKVNRSDLRQLLLVSKPVSEATIVAKELHFAFATPSAKKPGLFIRGEDDDDDEEEEHGGCWAPKQRRRVVAAAGRSRLGGKDLAGIAVNLAAAFDGLL